MANPTPGGAQEAEPVPTGIAFDQAGTAYASFLSGVPFSPGSAKVVTVPAGGTASDDANGLTTLTNLQTDPDGNLYAVQFGRFAQEGPGAQQGASGRDLRRGSGHDRSQAGPLRQRRGPLVHLGPPRRAIGL